MNKSASIANLASALAKAQAKMPVAIFDAKNPFLKNKYASLGAVISASKPVLAEFGLSISQFPVENDGKIGVVSILMHESGEFIENECYMTPEQQKGVNAGQAAGIVITYIRRYAWAAILGMYADADTDAHVDASMDSLNKEVEVIMKKRTWSLDVLEEVFKMAEFEDYDAVSAILDLSVLPENAPIGTIKSWFTHYMTNDGTEPISKAQHANTVYTEAKKNTKKTGGK